ncbi:hypothetical protein [Longimicrobium sp.]|uniref:hypothetical protein n=1 Tax=Longimicrobium sp. TaxID=2029185 RepID=UPI003B3A53AE
MGDPGPASAGGSPAVGEREHKRTGGGDEPLPVSDSASLGTDLAHVPSFELRHGPIPDADELVRYGEAHPDAPAIILAEFQAQAAHRRKMEQRGQVMDQKELDAAITSERFGLACALLIALVGFGCGTYLIATGHGVEGTIIFGLDVVALVSAFILGRARWETPSPRKQ